jgi:hypothetical protein
MHQAALFAPAAQKSSTNRAKQETARSSAALRVNVGPSGSWLVWCIAAAPASSVVLVVALVDPLRGSEGYDIRAESQDRGARYE